MSARIIALVISLLVFATSQTQAAERPNVVFILADDLGIHDLHCYDRADHATPHLDALAAQGTRFTSAYCAQPICSASRAAIMTGRSPARLHLTTYLPGRGDAPSQLLLHPEIEQQLPLAEVTIAEALKTAGYQSGCIGKWHLGGEGFSPLEQGFDEYYAGQANTEPTAAEGGKGEMDLTAKGIDFIERHREGPFFLYLAHNTPHIRLAETKERVEKHHAAFNPTYAAMIERLDESVGLILARLDELGLAENTLVIFTSDNGGLHVPEGEITPATHNTPYRAGKGFLYEGGSRIPLLVRWPGVIPAGKVIDAPVMNDAWQSTFREIAGVEADASIATSLAPLLRGEDAPPAEQFCWHFPHYTNQGSLPGGAIRAGSWKLIEHYEDGRLELFDLAADPSETRDVSAREPARVAELRGKLEAWRRAEGAQENQANSHFNESLWAALYGEHDVSLLAAQESFLESREAWLPWKKKMGAAARGANGPGAVILHARDATVHGEKLRYEPEPHKDTLGYWVNADDYAEWTFTPPRAGKYRVDVLQGCGDGSGGAQVELRVADQAVTFIVEETGHFQRFIPRTVGTLTFASSDPHTLTLRAKSKPNVAVMDLRRITLRAEEE